MDYNEKSHVHVNINKLLEDSTFPAEIKESVRMLKNIETNEYHLLVLDVLSSNTLYFDLIKQLRRRDIDFKTEWVDRQQLKKITDQFNITEGGESQSDSQAKILKIIETAVALGASDIHMNVMSSFFIVSYRIDGMKRHMKIFDDTAENGRNLVQTLYNSMCNERSIPTLSYTESTDAKIREEFVSGFGLSTGRFSSRPGGAGTVLVVVRLIVRRKSILKMESLGLNEKQITTIRRVLAKPSGVIFSSGPTGHGKSTLSQCMAELVIQNNPFLNLITVEDPIESPIEGAVQTPLIIADRSDRVLMGRAWGKAMSNLMRLDPDIIYIGEVRDSTSATGVIEAAQTGHNVITTIHTNHPIDIIQRLRRLGVDQDLLTDATLITCLIGLRLTPLLCPKCKVPYGQHNIEIENDVLEAIDKYLVKEKVFFKKHEGCEECEHTGVKGRTGVFEVIETDYTFMRLYEEEGKFAAWKHWRNTGGVTLCQNITQLVNSGVVDPIVAHKSICNLDRDDKFYE